MPHCKGWASASECRMGGTLSGDCPAPSQSTKPKCRMALSCGLYSAGSSVWSGLVSSRRHPELPRDEQLCAILSGASIGRPSRCRAPLDGFSVGQLTGVNYSCRFRSVDSRQGRQELTVWTPRAMALIPRCRHLD